MKKVLIGLLMLTAIVSYAGAAPDPNEKVLKAFKETFNDPKEVSWNEYDTHYEVNFKLNEIKTRVRYDKDGNVTGTTRYYYEQNLPPHIIAKLKKKFPGKSVFGVTEVSSESDIEYVIVLEDEKTWTEVRSNSIGYIEVLKKFKKA